MENNYNNWKIIGKTEQLIKSHEAQKNIAHETSQAMYFSINKVTC